MSEQNKGYKLCQSYPELMWIPNSLSDEQLLRAALFRTQSRVPMLSYMYENQATITRSSQPRVGVNDRSSDDEELLRYVSATLERLTIK